jgi:AraC family transcriptional regulator
MMDYYERIQQSIEYIEQNLLNELNISDVSSESCFSAFHFQKVFHAVTGFSVQQYIRNRRLSEAAILLRESNKTILEIAFCVQYGSQEAFTRAFVNLFCVTPANYRRGDIKLNLQLRIDFLEYKHTIKGNIIVNKPEITTLDRKCIIGYEYRANLNNEDHFNSIPKFYLDFGENKYYQRIPKRKAPNMSYGVSTNFQDNGHFSFIIGEEVEDLNTEINTCFVASEIPSGKYAKFKVSGSTELVQNTRRYIYGTWLPNSNYERREGPDIEVTDVLNSSFPDDMKMTIYIPIEKHS